MNYEKEIKAKIKDIETGNSEKVAYQYIAELMHEWMEKEDLTKQRVAERIGKSADWVRILLNARSLALQTGEFVIDWNSGKRTVAPKLPAKRAELATELLADPVIVEAVLNSRTKAASNVRKAVFREETEDRAQAHAANEAKQQAEALPINSLFPKISAQIDGWSNALLDIEEDLVEASDQFGAGLVLTALRMHADTCNRLADRMELDQPAAIERAG